MISHGFGKSKECNAKAIFTVKNGVIMGTVTV